MLSAANRNAPEPHGRVEDGHSLRWLPEGAEQVRAFAVLDHVLRELADVEIERDEVVDVCDFAGRRVSL